MKPEESAGCHQTLSRRWGLGTRPVLKWHIATCTSYFDGTQGKSYIPLFLGPTQFFTTFGPLVKKHHGNKSWDKPE